MKVTIEIEADVDHIAALLPICQALEDYHKEEGIDDEDYGYLLLPALRKILVILHDNGVAEGAAETVEKAHGLVVIMRMFADSIERVLRDNNA